MQFSRPSTENSDGPVSDVLLEEEQIAVEKYFSELDSAKGFVSRLTFQFVFYILAFAYLTIGALIGIWWQSSLASDQKVLISALVVAQVISCTLSLCLFQSALANESICESHVEYRVLGSLTKIRALAPILQLYCPGLANLPKKEPKVAPKLGILWMFRQYAGDSAYTMFMAICVLITTVNLYTLSLDGHYDSFELVLPWSAATYQSAVMNKFCFDILNDYLSYYKHVFYQSEFFSNPRWDKVIAKLAKNSNITRHHSAVAILDNDSNVTSTTVFRRTKSTGMRSDSTSVAVDINLLNLNATRSNSTQSENTAVTRQLEPNDPAAKEDLYSMLVVEEGDMKVGRLTQDIFVLQHMFQIFNKTIGLLFSCLAVLSVFLFAFSIFIVYKLATSALRSNIQTIIYIVQIATINMVLILKLLLDHNSFGKTIGSFISAVQLLCGHEAREELSELNENIPNLKLQILVFGFALTPEVVVSLMTTAFAAVATQLYTLLLSYSSH